MDKKIIIFALCAMMLSGCGLLEQAGENSAAESKAESSSAAEKTVTDTEDTDEKPDDDNESAEELDTSDMTVAFAVENAYGGYLGGRSENPKEFCDLVKATMENSEKVSRRDASDRSVSAGFTSGEEKYALQALDDGVFAWRDMNGKETVFFKPDEETAEKLKDMIMIYAAFGELGINDAVISESADTSILADIVKNKSDKYTEQRYYTVDDSLCKVINIEVEGSKGVYYCQSNNLEIGEGGDEDFYEFVCNGVGDSYSRSDINGGYTKNAGFCGDFEPDALPDYITKYSTYMYTLKVTSGDSEYLVEIYDSGSARTYVWADEQSGIRAVLTDSMYDGITLMENYYGADVAEDNRIQDMMTSAAQNIAKPSDGIPTFSPKNEQLAADTEKYGLFDLSGGVEVGEEVEPTGVVEEWRDYISSGGNPFTLEFRWAGGGRNEYQVSTTNGKDYYYRHDMELHKDDEDLGSETIYIDGRTFESIYYMNEIDNRTYTEWPRYDDSEPRLVTDLLFENEKYDEAYSGECRKAYKVTINGEEYICEEWSLYLGRLWKVYIKDGNIVAWEGDFYNDPTVNTIIRLEKTADDSLIKMPDKSEKYRPDPTEQPNAYGQN